jgi:hypothetical protein
MADTPFASLLHLLRAASDLVQRAATDPQLTRMLRIFDRIPDGDREILLDVLEREVEMRRVVGDAPPTLTGLELLRPNPNARLYMRVYGHTATPVEAEATDHHDLVASTMQTTRILGLILAPTMFDRWRAAAVEAFTRLEPAELEAARRVFDELVVMGAEAARTRAAGKVPTGRSGEAG